MATAQRISHQNLPYGSRFHCEYKTNRRNHNYYTVVHCTGNCNKKLRRWGGKKQPGTENQIAETRFEINRLTTDLTEASRCC
jgi:hypothetical protein